MISNPARKYGLAAGQTLLALLFAAVITAPLHAQEPSAPPPSQQGDPGGPPPHRGGGEMQEHQLEHLTKALNLTPDQVSQVKAIQADSRQQTMALRQDSSVAQADKRSRMMAIHQSEQAKVKALLNDDQKAKFDTMQQKMQERREHNQDQRQGGDAPPPPPPPAA